MEFIYEYNGKYYFSEEAVDEAISEHLEYTQPEIFTHSDFMVTESGEFEDEWGEVLTFKVTGKKYKVIAQEPIPLEFKIGTEVLELQRLSEETLGEIISIDEMLLTVTEDGTVIQIGFREQFEEIKA